MNSPERKRFIAGPVMAVPPKVSIVVPVYNAAGCVRTCLDALARQTFPDLEILAVDDASTDASPDILEEFAAGEPRLRVIVNPTNRNLYATRRIGFDNAAGDYVMVCDADDSLPADAVEKLHAAAVGKNADIVHGRAREAGGRRAGKILSNCEPFRARTGRESVREMLGNRRGWNLWGKLFRRRVVEECLSGLPEGTGWFMGEDILYSTLFGLAADTYAAVPDIVYNYRPASGSRLRDPETAAKAFRDQIEIIDCLQERLGADPSLNEFSSLLPPLAQHITLSLIRHAAPPVRDHLRRLAAECGMASTALSPLSPKYHWQWLVHHGLREYRLRLCSLWAIAERAGWRETLRTLAQMLRERFR